jgi:ligand-binding sensor domain-containing protein
MASTNSIRRMVEDKAGNLWMATGNGLACWTADRAHWEMHPPAIGNANKLSHPSIRGLAYDGKYLIIGPTLSGVWLFDPVNKKYHRPKLENEQVEELLTRDFIDDIVPISGKRHLIMGRDAIYVMDDQYRIKHVDIQAGRYNSNFALQGNDGCIWVGTNNGLYCLDSSLKQMAEVSFPAKTKMVQCGFIKGDHLLFATDAGVFSVHYSAKIFTVSKLNTAFDKLWLYILFEDERGDDLGLH